MDEIHNELKDEDETRENSSYEPYNENFEDIGNETRLLATNMGFASIMIILYLALTVLWLILLLLEKA